MWHLYPRASVVLFSACLILIVLINESRLFTYILFQKWDCTMNIHFLVTYSRVFHESFQTIHTYVIIYLNFITIDELPFMIVQLGLTIRRELTEITFNFLALGFIVRLHVLLVVISRLWQACILLFVIFRKKYIAIHDLNSFQFVCGISK